MITKQCQKCNNVAKYKCPKCKNTFYCGSHCQSLDWLKHRKLCGNQKTSYETYSYFDEIFEYNHPESKVTSIVPNLTGSFIIPGDRDYIYILEQSGYIQKFNIKKNKIENQVFLDISDYIAKLESIASSGFDDERGLLNAIAHPLFNTKGSPYEGVFYVLYSTASPKKKIIDVSKPKLQGTSNKEEKEGKGDKKNQNQTFYNSQNGMKNEHLTILSMFRYTHLNNKKTLDSEMKLIEIEEPEWNHNGGGLAFGPYDGYLYIGVGDGGGQKDQHGDLVDLKDKESYLGYAQDLKSFHGKILRIDINVLEPQSYVMEKIVYIIPTSNPFYRNKNGIKGEIFAYGFRNPWKISFSEDARLIVADVGQSGNEMIKIVKKGMNYGWRAYEGSTILNTSLLTYLEKKKIEFQFPILEYKHKDEDNSAIIGGYEYKGHNVRKLHGKYIFADYSGKIFMAICDHKSKDIKHWEKKLLARLPKGVFIHSFAEDYYGELYVLAVNKGEKKNLIFKLKSNLLSHKEIKGILEKTKKAAMETTSDLRRNEQNNPTNTKMHIALITINGYLYNKSMADAWKGSMDIAISKANTAISFSSNENALTSRSIGQLSQPGEPLWVIYYYFIFIFILLLFVFFLSFFIFFLFYLII